VDLSDFLRQTQSEVRTEIRERMGSADAAYPYPESVFAETVMQHMSDVGMTFDDPATCHFERTVGNAILRLNGYALSEDSDQLDLFVCLYAGSDELASIPDSETQQAAVRCLNLLARCVDGRLARNLDSSDEAYPFVVTVQECYGKFDQIRVYVLTDRQAKAKRFKPREISGKTVMLEVMDIERLYRHWSEGKPRDELTMDMREICGGALPCVHVRSEGSEYDYALTALPGEALRFIYEKYGARLLEANVRSFLSITGKVNRGIRDTLMSAPERFMAYNNGIVIVADEAEFGSASDGSPGLLWLKGMQIVNGGQTTASLYFARKKSPEIDLRLVRVATKIILPRAVNAAAEEVLVADISKCSNSQNAVRSSDLAANKPYQVELERLSTTVYCPDGVSRWFYERAAGRYHVMLMREGTTPARLRSLKSSIPSSRRITKTDFAKYMNAWAEKPHLVSLGAQKNFDKFMENITASGSEAPLPDAASYKLMIAKAIVFRRAQNLIRPLFAAFQANIVSYLIAVVANRIGSRISLQRIWERQDISPEFSGQLRTWASEVHRALSDSAEGRMLSEWAKKEEAWEVVRAASYSAVADLPEFH
jgi:hypothetical protein